MHAGADGSKACSCCLNAKQSRNETKLLVTAALTMQTWPLYWNHSLSLTQCLWQQPKRQQQDRQSIEDIRKPCNM
jgi:hypothetical protein